MRSSLGRQVFAATAVVGFIGAAVVLLLSDRVPALAGDAMTLAHIAVDEFEAIFGVDLVKPPQLAGRIDAVGHAVLWGTGMAVFGLALRRRVPLSVTAIILAGVSLVSEYAQAAWSSSRSAQLTDAVANMIGIAVVAVVLGIVLAAVRFFRGDDRHFTDDRRPTSVEAPTPPFEPAWPDEPTREIPAVR